MRKPIIALASIASIVCGLAVMGVVISIQQDPLAWTQASRQSAADPQAATVVPEQPAAAPRAAASKEAMPLVELPEVRITSSRQYEQWTESGEPEQLESALEPCSEWREIGPTHVDQGVPSGSQRVRQLC